MAAALLYSSAGRSWSTRVDGLDRYQRMRVHPLREREREESPSLELGYHQRTHRVNIENRGIPTPGWRVTSAQTTRTLSRTRRPHRHSPRGAESPLPPRAAAAR